MTQLNHYQHPLVAHNYQFRCPYDPNFFTKLAHDLAINQSSRALDLCSGSGEVANLLAEHCGSILAIDQSALMIANSSSKENVNFSQGDLNDDEFLQTLPENCCEFIFVGRGIHWINDKSLAFIADRCLVKNGYLLTVQSGFGRHTLWLAQYYKIIENALGSSTPKIDWVCQQKILDAGFNFLDKVVQPFQVKMNVDSLLGQAMSYRMDRALEIEKLQVELKRQLQSTLHEHIQDDYLLADVVSSALIYKRSV